MTTSMHTLSVPVFKQMLGGLSDILQKAETHAELKKFEPSALLQARLYPDMFALTQQVQVACDFASSVSARLAGVDVPTTNATEQTFAELRGRIKNVIEYLDGLNPTAFASSATREIILRPGTPKEKRLDGQTYLTRYGMPQFFFHVTTAYAILRHNGVEVGKKDFMGVY